VTAIKFYYVRYGRPCRKILKYKVRYVMPLATPVHRRTGSRGQANLPRRLGSPRANGASRETWEVTYVT